MSLSPLSNHKADLPERPLTPAAKPEAGPAAYQADQYVTSRQVRRQTPAGKAWLGLRTAGTMLPRVATAMWNQKGQVAKSFFDAYVHPVRSVKAMNESARAAFREGPVEGTLSIAKNHVALLSAWTLPVALGMMPFSAHAAAVFTTGGVLGTVSLVALALSMGKNIIDASQAKNARELQRQSEQIVADGVGLGFAAVSAIATTGIQGTVRVTKGQRFMGESLPSPTPTGVESEDDEPEATQ